MEESGDFQINAAFANQPNLGVPGTFVNQKLLLNGNYTFKIRFMSVLASNGITVVATTGAPVFFFVSPQLTNPATGVNYFAAAQSNGVLNLTSEYNFVFDAYIQGNLEFNLLVGDLPAFGSPVIPSQRNNLRIANDYYTTATGIGANTFMQVNIEYIKKHK